MKIGPVLPVKIGEKGPPFIKEWQTISRESLEFESLRFPHSNKGLRLDAYLALDPDDMAAAKILDELESQGKLPPTVAWKTWRGMTVRLYNRYNGIRPFKPTHSPKLEIRTAMGQYVLIPPSTYKSGKYQWLPDQDPESIEVADLPTETIEEIASRLKTDSETTKVKAPGLDEYCRLWQGVAKGNINDALIRLTGHLVNRGLQEEEILHIMRAWNQKNEPPAPEKDIDDRVRGIVRADSKKYNRNRNIVGELREWIKVSSSEFNLKTCEMDLGIFSIEEKAALRQGLVTLTREGSLARVLEKRGFYRPIEAEVPRIKLTEINDSEKEINLKLPFELQEYVRILPKTVIIVAGEKDAGKTAFLLNCAKLNYHLAPIYYFTSEMGGSELVSRVSLFDEINLHEWDEKVHIYPKSENFAEAIRPDHINLIDFLEIYENFYLVAKLITAMWQKLNRGVAIIGLQKSKGTEWGRGGSFCAEKARLFISLESGDIEKLNQCRILAAKNWRDSRVNPKGKIFYFKLAAGCKFI